MQPFQGYHATDDHHQHLTPRRPVSAHRQREGGGEGGGKGKNAAVGKNVGRGEEVRKQERLIVGEVLNEPRGIIDLLKVQSLH